MPTKAELDILRALPLDIKIAKTQKRISEFVSQYGVDGVYIGFSGGKDSTVLLHIARRLFPDIEAVFVDTGLEYPEIRKFVKQHDNVEIIRPKMRFDQVIRKYGYPLISKEVSGTIGEVSNPNYKGHSKLQALNGQKVLNGKYSPFNQEKWKPLMNVDFKISNRCCGVMKKSPSKSFESKNDKHPIMAMMTEESRLRTQKWLKQ